MQLEYNLCRYLCRYTPELLKERHAIIEKIIKLAPNADGTVVEDSAAKVFNSMIEQIGTKRIYELQQTYKIREIVKT